MNKHTLLNNVNNVMFKWTFTSRKDPFMLMACGAVSSAPSASLKN